PLVPASTSSTIAQKPPTQVRRRRDASSARFFAAARAAIKATRNIQTTSGKLLGKRTRGRFRIFSLCAGPLVFTVTVNGIAPVPLTTSDGAWQLAPIGAPEHVNVTFPMNPGPGVSCKLY